jgi:hypothetical protein
MGLSSAVALPKLVGQQPMPCTCLQPLLLPPNTPPAYSCATHLVSRVLSICYSLGAVTTTPADASNSSGSVWGRVRLEALREPRHAGVLQQLLEVYGAGQEAGLGCVPLQPLRQRYCLDLLLAGEWLCSRWPRTS